MKTGRESSRTSRWASPFAGPGMQKGRDKPFICSPHPLSWLPLVKTRHKGEQGWRGRIRAGRSAGSRQGEISWPLTELEKMQGCSREDLISCYGRGSVRGWWEQLWEKNRAVSRPPVSRDGAEGSSPWEVHTASDDRSESWGLESVTQRYSKQDYEIEEAIMGHLP